MPKPELRPSLYRDYSGGELEFTVPMNVGRKEMTAVFIPAVRPQDVWVHHLYLGPNVEKPQPRRFFDQAYPYQAAVGPRVTEKEQLEVYEDNAVPLAPTEYGTPTLIWDRKIQRLSILEFPPDSHDLQGTITAVSMKNQPDEGHIEVYGATARTLSRFGFHHGDFDYVDSSDKIEREQSEPLLDRMINKIGALTDVFLSPSAPEGHIIEVVRATNTRPVDSFSS